MDVLQGPTYVIVCWLNKTNTTLSSKHQNCVPDIFAKLFLYKVVAKKQHIRRTWCSRAKSDIDIKPFLDTLKFYT